MSRISSTLNDIKQASQKALVTYIVAGDPDASTTVKIMHDVVAGGADIIELGMPFTDPMADGPIIQAAHLRALAQKTDLVKVLDIVRSFRAQNSSTPIVLMGYANPIHAYGIDRFYSDAFQSGVDGTLIVDVPPEEDSEWVNASQDNKLDFIRLATPTTNSDRLKIIIKHASGFLYYVSIAGITGTVTSNSHDIKDHVTMIRGHTNLPIMIGFGIKTHDDALSMSALGDGIVVGSALINAYTNHQNVKEFISQFKT